MLCLGVLLAWGMSLEQVVRMLSAVHPVPGRMNTYGGRGQPLVVIDYAHTPDALEKVLASLRAHTRGSLVCVFGCGGDRDRGKRPLMGEVASRLADDVLLTDDNPRGEEPAAIVRDILEGAAAAENVQVVHDRARAIELAVTAARADDLVLVAGKGHEAWQQRGDLRIPFSDREQVEACLRRMQA
jgi:UDP-N-acetylmuramoyl-L-alanyl-D-glutamate--2,6-diaminopimelate ligase